MKTFAMILIFTLFTIAFCYANRDELVLVDTVCAVIPLTNSIFYNMQTNAYSYFPNYATLEIRYGRNGWGDPGIIEVRAFATFQTQAIPHNYYIYRAELQFYCTYFFDNSDELVWPQYYSIPYQVLIDHIQFESFLPEIFGQQALSPNIAVLQDSAYIGWVGTDITNSYLEDIQQSRAYSQYRLHFPQGYDVSGYEVDMVYYGRGPEASPKLILTYHKTVSNNDAVLPVHSDLINGIYPQPSRDVLNIEFIDKNTSSIDLSLYDLKGRLVHSETDIPILNGTTQLHITDYPSGIYYLKVTDRHRCQTRKFTIMK